MEFAELGHFLSHVGNLFGRVVGLWLCLVVSLVRLPFVGEFVEFLPIIGQLLGRRVDGFGLLARRFRACWQAR